MKNEIKIDDSVITADYFKGKLAGFTIVNPIKDALLGYGSNNDSSHDFNNEESLQLVKFMYSHMKAVVDKEITK
tara:strand:+ start:39 stop:260 length:222 start_codon:yes stop_codon:yes gene_type:complete